MNDAPDLRDRCQWRRCRQESAVLYRGIGVCEKHHSEIWNHARDYETSAFQILARKLKPEAKEALA